jgi:type IV pilus assembly protein PilV
MTEHRHRIRTGPRQVAGFTLVEAMVALLVLSIGLLGIAALYVETLRSNRTALFRTQAVTLASDLADRIRASGIRSDRIPLLPAPGGYACGDPCDPATAAAGVPQADLTQWTTEVGALLPEGFGAVTYVDDGVATTPNVYTIVVGWTELGQDDPVRYQLRVEI